ncbi:TldD/PmbA family protein [Candidatus Thorarchaeota archaeon]|nr:MAG: TldD/PmbA family protein [Candidatus Thorarchaeota archaeon]
MMVSENELLELCKYIVATGKNAGATAIEALAQFENQIESDIELSQISSVNQRISTEIAIRLYIGKKMGSAFTNIATKESAKESVDLAIAAAKVTTEDKDWIDLPHPQEYPTLDGLWYEEVVNANPSEIVSSTGELITKGSQSEPGLLIVAGGSAAYYGVTAYANSNDVTYSTKGTGSFIAEAAIAQTEKSTTPMVMAYDIQRNLNLDIDGTVKNVAEQIRRIKVPATGKTGKYKIILHPQAYSALFTYTLMQGVRGDNVARGKSMIADKIGDQIASEIFTLVDDGLYPTSAVTSIADDEGVPRQRTPIIENGVLRSFLWDTYWANKMDLTSTGNASRNMRQGLVEIGFTTLVIEPGTREIEDIISEFDYSYYIQNVQGAHSSNPESGDFSVVGNPAILIENGKMVGGVDGLMISGNIFDFLKNVTEIAKTAIPRFSWIGPEIVVKDIDVVAKD